MFQFHRTVTLKDSSRTPKAIEASTKIVSFLKENYDLELHHGVEMFGSAQIHWWFETKSLDDVTQLNGKLMQDKNYIGLVAEYSDLWIDGSLQDKIIKAL